MQRMISVAASLTLGASLAFGSDTVVSGYSLYAQANPAFGSVTCSLPGGDFVTFDGSSVDRWTSSGSLVLHIGTLPSYVFASFVEPTPDGTALVLADSGATAAPDGHLRLAQLDGSGIGTPVQLVYPFDAVFLPDGDLLVSAATHGAGVGNELVRVDFPTLTPTWIGHVDGPSGPLAIGRSGEVYYATQGPGFSPPPGSTSIVRWSAAQVAAGALDDNNASVLAAGFDGGSALAYDALGGHLYLAINVYSPVPSSRIVRVKTSAANSPVLVDAANPVLGLRFVQGAGDARFEAYQPADGLRLSYDTSDFWSLSDMVEIAPKRPLMTSSGAGLNGVGAFTLSLQGGVPNGSALLTYCPQIDVLPFETSYGLQRFLHHSPFVLASTLRFSFLVPTDANGDASLSFWNPGNLQGQYGWQFLVGRANGVLIGSSNALQF